MTKLYYVYFAGCSESKTAVEAKTRKEAINIFAALHGVKPSSYIMTSK